MVVDAQYDLTSYPVPSGSRIQALLGIVKCNRFFPVRLVDYPLRPTVRTYTKDPFLIFWERNQLWETTFSKFTKKVPFWKIFVDDPRKCSKTCRIFSQLIPSLNVSRSQFSLSGIPSTNSPRASVLERSESGTSLLDGWGVQSRRESMLKRLTRRFLTVFDDAITNL